MMNRYWAVVGWVKRCWVGLRCLWAGSGYRFGRLRRMNRVVVGVVMIVGGAEAGGENYGPVNGPGARIWKYSNITLQSNKLGSQ